jgi:hypothetical protein
VIPSEAAMCSHSYIQCTIGQSRVCPGTSYRRETNVDPVNPEPLGCRFNGCEDKAPAISNGGTVLVCPVVDVVKEELVEDISFAPEGSAGTQTDARSGREIPLISNPSNTVSMALFAAALYLVHPGPSH